MTTKVEFQGDGCSDFGLGVLKAQAEESRLVMMRQKSLSRNGINERGGLINE